MSRFLHIPWLEPHTRINLPKHLSRLFTSLRSGNVFAVIKDKRSSLYKGSHVCRALPYEPGGTG
jgi:hypothetical protein